MAARKVLKAKYRMAPPLPLSRTTGALVRSLTVPMTVDVNDAAALQREAEADAKELGRLLSSGVQTEEQYAAADEMLTGLARRLDAVEKMRRSAVDPLNAVVKTINGWFKPATDALKEGMSTCKGALGAYRLAQAKALAAADAKVAAAAERGDNRALVRALEASTRAASAGESGRAVVRFRWTVKSAHPAKMAQHAEARSFLVADVKALESWANSLQNDERGVVEPEVPGVTFEKTAIVGAKR